MTKPLRLAAELLKGSEIGILNDYGYIPVIIKATQQCHLNNIDCELN